MYDHPEVDRIGFFQRSCSIYSRMAVFTYIYISYIFHIQHLLWYLELRSPQFSSPEEEVLLALRDAFAVPAAGPWLEPGDEWLRAGNFHRSH